MRKEKQLLMDAQRQAALEKEVCLPTFSLVCPPPSVHLFCPGPWGSKTVLATIMLASGPDFQALGSGTLVGDQELADPRS